MDELRTALELATEAERQDLTSILFQRRFNPLDYLGSTHPDNIQSCSEEQWLDMLEDRFRFLAADGLTVLKQQTEFVSYRQVLIQICRYLKIRYSPTWSATQLEAEIFLHLVQRTWSTLPPSEQQTLARRVQAALADSTTEPLPLDCQADPLRLLFSGGGALAVGSVVRPFLLRQLAKQFASHMLAYQASRGTVALSGSVAAQAARRGMAITAARYGAVRSACALLGSVLWVSFAVDLGWRAIATNYARIIPAVFTLAQIRLIRDEQWQLAYTD